MRKMHFKSRQADDTQAMRILQSCEYGILATVDSDGNPYGVPMSYGLIDRTVYLHCAKKGYKVENIQAHPQVTFTVVSQSEPAYAAPHFTAYYESAIVYGTLRRVDAEEERIASLRNICERLVPEAADHIEEAIAQDGPATLIYALDVDEISGKIAAPQVF